MDVADPHFCCYDLAVVRGIAASLPEKALRQNDQVAAIDLQTAARQHSEYINVGEFSHHLWANNYMWLPHTTVKVLKELVPEIVVLPADEMFPDCVFIEDTAVVADGVALITIPGIILSG